MSNQENMNAKKLIDEAEKNEELNETDPVKNYIKNSPDLNQMNEKMSSLSNDLSKSSENINSLNSRLNDKRQRLMRQEAEIAQKKKIILTRNRMLNISEANNRYNQKLIYTFVSIVFGLFIIMLVLYTYNNKNYIKKNKLVNAVSNSNIGNN